MEQVTKEQVWQYWNNNVCDTAKGKGKHGKEYYEAIEYSRIASLSFMKPTHYTGKTVLEVGVGSGVDFVQWCKAGADAYGIDLTAAGVIHTKEWLKFLHLDVFASDVKIGDAENLLFKDNTFDLVYSWGVLHHSPDTTKAIKECIRVCRQGGEIKLMLYHKWSLLWLGAKTLERFTAKRFESPGTKAFSRNYIRKFTNIEVISIRTPLNDYDLLSRFSRPLRICAWIVNWLTGMNNGFFMEICLRKI